ncbi:MAG: hypothetical protein Q8R67_16840 [Rhodoferax sp.]|nr:hypothetical protein [Rhodoferax sp.]MDP3653336.1 hypothetical protein [Rhodoferax sp.]
MRDRPSNQAAGLLELAIPQAPKLMAVVSHGDEQSELPVLWRLCTSLVDFGYAVTVLDATTCESEANPGLEQLLEYAYWRGSENPDAPAWNVIPAGMGLQSLNAVPERKAQSLQHLGRLFFHEGVVIVYGKAEWLTPLLANSGIKPLLALAPVKRSLLTSYLALKRLLLKGGLQPTIVNMVDDKQRAAGPEANTVALNLSDCARNFLGFDVNALDITTPDDLDRPCADIQRLALQMLESALPLTAGAPESAPYAQPSSNNYFAGSH